MVDEMVVRNEEKRTGADLCTMQITTKCKFQGTAVKSMSVQSWRGVYIVQRGTGEIAACQITNFWK